MAWRLAALDFSSSLVEPIRAISERLDGPSGRPMIFLRVDDQTKVRAEFLGKRHEGSHAALVTLETFQQVQDRLGGKKRPRDPSKRHAFMGLLTCARCGCAMTAERKKGKYVYYRCTGFKGRCGNTYIREEALADLLGTTIRRVRIPADVADQIAAALRDDAGRAAQEVTSARQRLEERKRKLLAKTDRAYDDYVEGRVTEEFWTRKSNEWEDERRTIEIELARLSATNGSIAVTGERILELAKRAEKLYKAQDPAEQRKLLEIVLSNCTFDRGSLCPTYSKPFDLFAKANESGNWR